ncbi:FUSC family protein [Trinickia dinghuensis]|uniref:FUSC family protein n=1 Tax=Trinickia dinghuensis TaxID=2291023 RepID=A0A3D8K6R0_9BURK|nr:FUSC family protein [Trinickia dinghuensis]RDV00576.1 FUSC family protein [Trinickia dinghuensis]
MTDDEREVTTETEGETKAERHEARMQAANVLIDLVKGSPFLDRISEGVLMALQAVCGACLAYGIASAFDTKQPFWAAITAIAVTQHRYSDTRNLSRDQFIGAFAGGLFGFVGAWLGAGAHEIVGYATTIAAVILACWCVNVGSAARLGAITATIVLLVPMQGPLWGVPLSRLLQVILGTTSTLVVSGIFTQAGKRLSKR